MRKEPIIKYNKHKFDSYLGYNTSWWHYYSQYKMVVDELVISIEKGDCPIDTVSIPLLFLLRHSLELGIKANILHFEKINPCCTKLKLGGKKSHSLEFLFDQFLKHLNYIIKTYSLDKETINHINNYILKFNPLKTKLHNLDVNSICFRYPIDSKGNNNFNWNDRQDLREILNVYFEIQPFLLYVSNSFDYLMEDQIY